MAEIKGRTDAKNAKWLNNRLLVSIIVSFKKRILRNTNSRVKNLHNNISHWPNFTKYIPSLKWKILCVKFLCCVLSLTHASVYSIHLMMPQLIHLSSFTAFHVSKPVCDKNANKGYSEKMKHKIEWKRHKAWSSLSVSGCLVSRCQYKISSLAKVFKVCGIIGSKSNAEISKRSRVTPPAEIRQQSQEKLAFK